MRWRTRPSNFKTVIAVEEEPHERPRLFETMYEIDLKVSTEDEEIVKNNCTTLLSIFKERLPKKRPAEGNIEEQFNEEEAKYRRAQEKLALELGQAEDFSLCIEEEGTGKRLYIEPGGNVVPYDQKKREECKLKLEEGLEDQKKALEELRQLKNQQLKRKPAKPQKKNSKKKTQAAENVRRQVEYEGSEGIPDVEKSHTEEGTLTFNRISLAYPAEPSRCHEVVTVASDEDMEVLEDTKESASPSTSRIIMPPTNIRKSSSLPLRRFSQLPFSPITQSSKRDHSPRQASTNFFTSTPVGSKAYTTSTPFTEKSSRTPILFETDEENNSVADKENVSEIEQQGKFGRKKSEDLLTTAIAGEATSLGEITTATAINATGASTVYKTRNFTQIISFYTDGDSRASSMPPYYLDSYQGINNEYNHLLFVTNQTEPMQWEQMNLNNVRKLGEGTFGEVFATDYQGHKAAVKIIPFNNDVWRYEGLVNGEKLQDSLMIIPEVLITKELAALDTLGGEREEKNSCSNFIKLHGAHIIQGKYPPQLIKEWKKWKKTNKCDNECPQKYATDTQLFLAIYLAQGGVDLEAKTLRDESQVMSVFLQVVLALIIAEAELEFEHRDLHWGNILVDECESPINYRYEGANLSIASHGVKANIIDFTLSRLYKKHTVLYKDLANDTELFEGTGDYQFDIYRMMKEVVGDNEWNMFFSKNNALWAHYLIRQMIVVKKCEQPIPQERQDELMKIFDHLKEVDSLSDFMSDHRFTGIVSQYITMEK